MKKKIALILSIITVLSLTACGGNRIGDVGTGTIGNLGKSGAPAAEAAASDYYNDDYDSYGSNGVNGMDGMSGITGSTGATANSADAVSDTSAESVSGDDEYTANTNVTFDEDRKLIYHADVTLETLNYKKTYDELIKIINKYNGYIQSENYTNDDGSYLRADDEVRYGLNIYGQNNICIRVPRKNYDDFMKDGLALGNVIGRTQSVDDQTANYATNQSYIEILNKKVEYYDSQLSKLDQELTDAMKEDDSDKFEQILRDMQYMSNMKAEVENELIPYKRHNDQIDAESSYATINMTIREVKEYTKPEIEVEPEVEPTFGERVDQAFEDSMNRFTSWIENLVILCIYILPIFMILAIPAILVLIIILIVRKIHKTKLVKSVQKEVVKDVEDIEIPTYDADDIHLTETDVDSESGEGE